ncbi:MAG: hypothetical protein IH989_08555 [Planctomycetes bacterium]|nr:hypothetical protein [Planctomycetota bacterium]
MLGFLLRFLVLYLLLMMPWPGVETNYRDAFVKGGELLYRNLGEYYDIRLPEETKDKGPDVVIVVPRRDMGKLVELGISSREVGYLGSVVVVSLMLATPVAWRRRLWILGLGFALTCLFVIVRPLPLVLYTRMADADILSGAVEPGAYQEALAAIVKFVGFGQPMSYIVPIIIWLLVAVRRDVVVQLLPELGRSAAQNERNR